MKHINIVISDDPYFDISPEETKQKLQLIQLHLQHLQKLGVVVHFTGKGVMIERGLKKNLADIAKFEVDEDVDYRFHIDNKLQNVVDALNRVIADEEKELAPRKAILKKLAEEAANVVNEAAHKKVFAPIAKQAAKVAANKIAKIERNELATFVREAIAALPKGFPKSYNKGWKVAKEGESEGQQMLKNVIKLAHNYSAHRFLHWGRKHSAAAKDLEFFAKMLQKTSFNDTEIQARLHNKLVELVKDMQGQDPKFTTTGSFGRRVLFAVSKVTDLANVEPKAQAGAEAKAKLGEEEIQVAAAAQLGSK